MVGPGHVFLRFTPKAVFSLAFWNVYTMFLSVDDFRLFVTHVTWPTVILRKSKPSFESERLCSEGGKVHRYPCTSSSVKPVSASTSKTCQGEANLGRIPFLNARTQTRIHAHHYKQSPLHADTWSLQIIPAPPWLEKIRESWKMPPWKRNHLLTFAHFKRYYRCCDWMQRK